jgi:hypothetical protein
MASEVELGINELFEQVVMSVSLCPRCIGSDVKGIASIVGWVYPVAIALSAE